MFFNRKNLSNEDIQFFLDYLNKKTVNTENNVNKELLKLLFINIKKEENLYDVNSLIKSITRNVSMLHTETEGEVEELHLLENQDSVFSLISKDDFSKYQNDIKIANFKYYGRKNPTITKAYLNSGTFKDHSEEDLQKGYDIILKLKPLLKNKSHSEVFDISSFIYFDNEDNKNKKINIIDLMKFFSLEDTYDLYTDLQEHHDVTQAIKQTSSLRHRDWLNNNFDKIKEVLRTGITVQDFRNEFTKKISKYNNELEFSTALEKYLSLKSGWDIDLWKQKANELNLEAVEQESNILIIEIDSYENLSKIGSPQWCIATDEKYFNDYSQDYQQQYMILNFNLDIENPESMIGATVNRYGELLYSHDKNDDDLMDSKIETMIISTINKAFKPLSKNEDKIIKLINKNIKSNKSDIMRHPAELFKWYSVYNIDNDGFQKSKLDLKKVLTHKHVSKYERTEVINNMISYNMTETTDDNVSESLDFLKTVSDNFFDLWECDTKTLAKLFSSNGSREITDIFFTQYSPDDQQKEWNEIYKIIKLSSIEPLGNGPTVILKEFFQRNETNFWEILSHQDQEELADVLFRFDPISHILGNTKIPDNIAVYGIPRYPSARISSISFEQLDHCNIGTLVSEFIDRRELNNICNLTGFMDLDFCQEIITNSIDKMINKHGYLYDLENFNLNHVNNPIIRTFINRIKNNTDKIKIHNEIDTDFMSDYALRTMLLKNDLFIDKEYTAIYCEDCILNDDDWFDKPGMPLIISTFSKELKGDNQFPEWDDEMLKKNIQQYIENATSEGISLQSLNKEFKKNLKKFPDYLNESLSIKQNKKLKPNI
jgi:hypothetical protein